MISIHVSREGYDISNGLHNGLLSLISIHVSREGYDACISILLPPRAISIHVSREGYDHATYLILMLAQYFNPRIP